MVRKRASWVLATLFILFLVGCQSAEPTAAPSTGSEGGAGPAGGLGDVNALALGTLGLEDTENAVTQEQARALLPLWQAVASGALQGDSEAQAVLKQIEGVMTASQLAAIEDMAPTLGDMQVRQEPGAEMPTPGTGQQAPGTLQGLSEEERAQMREQFQNTTPEERATRMAEMGAEGLGARQGGSPPSGAFGGGQTNLFLEPLITLLRARASG